MSETETSRARARRRIAGAFTEWLRRAKEDPARYERDFMKHDSSTYGEAACNFFCELLAEQPMEIEQDDIAEAARAETALRDMVDDAQTQGMYLK
jgi:hypothetical protein